MLAAHTPPTHHLRERKGDNLSHSRDNVLRRRPVLVDAVSAFYHFSSPSLNGYNSMLVAHSHVALTGWYQLQNCDLSIHAWHVDVSHFSDVEQTEPHSKSQYPRHLPIGVTVRLQIFIAQITHCRSWQDGQCDNNTLAEPQMQMMF